VELGRLPWETSPADWSPSASHSPSLSKLLSCWPPSSLGWVSGVDVRPWCTLSGPLWRSPTFPQTPAACFKLTSSTHSTGWTVLQLSEKSDTCFLSWPGDLSPLMGLRQSSCLVRQFPPGRPSCLLVLCCGSPSCHPEDCC
jgi:hypothetical protein